MGRHAEALKRPMSGLVKWPLLIGVSLLITGPLAGVSGTVLAMMRAFDTLSESGVAPAGDLSEAVASSLTTTMVGLAVAALGVLLLILALIAHMATRDRAPARQRAA